MNTRNICFYGEIKKKKTTIFTRCSFLSGAMASRNRGFWWAALQTSGQLLVVSLISQNKKKTKQNSI